MQLNALNPLAFLRNYFRKSIYRKLVTAFVLSTTFLLMVSGYLLVHREEQFLEDRSKDQATHLAEILAVSSSSWVLANDVVGLQEVVRSVNRMGRQHYVLVISPDGRVLASSNTTQVGRYADDAVSRSLRGAQATTRILVQNANLIDVAAPVMAGGRLVAWARVGKDAGEDLAYLTEISLYNHVFAFIGFVLSLGLAVFLARGMTKGLYRLMLTASQVQYGQMDVRAHLGNEDEIGQLAQDFNRMLDSLAASEKKLEKLNRAYAAWTHSTAVIVREHNEQALLNTVCQILAERVPFKLVWAGITDQQGWVQVAASSDPASQYLNRDIRISVNPFIPEGRVPMSIAIREGVPQMHNDFANDAAIPWRAAAEAEGFVSVAAFPLVREGRSIGALSVYSTEKNFIDADLSLLLHGLTDDISFALDNFTREEKRAKAEAQLQLAARVFESSSEGIVVTDIDRNIISVNAAFEVITGYTSAETLGKNPRLLSSGRHSPEFFRELWQSLEQAGAWQGEIWNRRKSGEIYPEWLNISTVKNAEGEVTNYVGIFSDISERKATEERMQHMAHFDALTDLPNRVLLHDRLAQAMIRAQRSHGKVAMIFVDLDRFKVINDTLGHGIGDTLLQTVARRMLECVREQDTVSRQGGDEFLIVLPDADYEGAAHVAQKLLEVVARPYLIDGHDLTVTPSVGISLYPDDAGDIETLIKNADVAMYSAKENGRNNYQFYKRSMNATAFERLSMENNLRRALERDEFLLYYQPQVALATGKVIGCEALIRWRHGELGMVSPASFIPVAEESGLIGPIGEWVLETACQQMAAWRASGLPHVSVAVNLSSLQFRQPGLAEKVAHVLARADLPPRCLELELTEGILMIEAEQSIQTIQQLGAMGLHLAIDDFGTGYSSLSYLKRFPINKLKIDQSFVRDIATDPDDAAIVRTIIAMSHSLNIKVIAEGVETEQQLDFLREADCEEFQGYLFSKPLPANEFAELLRSDKRLKE